MPFYETTLIARQDISNQQAELITTQFTDILKAGGGEVAKSEYWGLRSLAYKIKKNKKGHYMFLTINAPAAAVVEMERNMSLHEDVLRFLTIKTDTLDTTPSVMMQARERSDRFERGGDNFGGDRDRGPRDGYRPRRDDSMDDAGISDNY